jgi:hypothetical protein
MVEAIQTQITHPGRNSTSLKCMVLFNLLPATAKAVISASPQLASLTLGLEVLDQSLFEFIATRQQLKAIDFVFGGPGWKVRLFLCN